MRRPVFVLSMMIAFGCAHATDDARHHGNGAGTATGSTAVAGGASDIGGSTAGPTGPAAGSGGAGGLSGGGTGFTSVMQMFDWVNVTREQYQDHIPYDGYPFQGANAGTMTWALTFVWDAALAAEAQNEALALAQGAAPVGLYFPFQNNSSGEGFWVTGLDTPKYELRALSDPTVTGWVDGFGNPQPAPKWHTTSNGMYRLAVAYQTGTGAFHSKTKLGVGGADIEDKTWWVLIFGE